MHVPLVNSTLQLLHSELGFYCSRTKDSAPTRLWPSIVSNQTEPTHKGKLTLKLHTETQKAKWLTSYPFWVERINEQQFAEVHLVFAHRLKQS